MQGRRGRLRANTLSPPPRPVVVLVTQLLLAAVACVDGHDSDSDGLSTPTETSSPQGNGNPKRSPNIVIIVADDQRWDTLPSMPNTLRWFQERGVNYTQAFTVSPLCCPSRASIFTGRYPHNHGVLNNFMPEKLDQSTTLQARLHRRGYRTAIAGKFLNGWSIETDPPHFDRWAIFDDNFRYYGVPFNVDGAIRKVSGYSTSFIESRAIRFLRFFEQTDHRPFLLYATVFSAHSGFAAEPRYVHANVEPWSGNPATAEKNRSDKPPFVQTSELHLRAGDEIRRQQIRTLYSVDDLVGRVMRELSRLEEVGKTLAFYLSDSGHFWAEHGLGDKRFPYTQGVQVPLLMRYPGHVAPGSTDDRLAATIDVTPTALAAAGVHLRKDQLDGRDLLGPRRQRLLLEYFEDPVFPVPEWSSVRTKEYQYVEYYGDHDQTIYREYYELSEDPWQLANMVHDGADNGHPNRAVLRRLSRVLARDRVCRGTVGSRACP
jgi:arylsulfatase A-like enzyme